MPALTRRNLLTITGAGAAAALVEYPSSTASADAEASTQSGLQAPFYRSKLGSANITVVSDGMIAFPPNVLWPKVPKAELEGYLSDFHQPTDSIPLQVNAIVVDLNGRRVLVDTGNGQGKFQPTAGRLLENLQAAGIDPGTIDTVVFTHLHPDHMWGITDADNETLTFPNAEYVVAEPERAFWSSPELPGKMPNDFMREMTLTTQAHMASMEDRLRTAATTAEVSPGVTFMPTPGHTPGHVAIMLESDGENLIVSGDVIGNSEVSFDHPEWAVGFDSDMEQGTASRLEFLDMTATDRLRVFAYHLPWPGFGHVARSGEAYRWIQEEWDWRL